MTSATQSADPPASDPPPRRVRRSQARHKDSRHAGLGCVSPLCGSAEGAVLRRRPTEGTHRRWSPARSER
jgi:hypothetical protein